MLPKIESFGLPCMKLCSEAAQERRGNRQAGRSEQRTTSASPVYPSRVPKLKFSKYEDLRKAKRQCSLLHLQRWLYETQTRQGFRGAQSSYRVIYSRPDCLQSSLLQPCLDTSTATRFNYCTERVLWRGPQGCTLPQAGMFPQGDNSHIWVAKSA